MHRVLAVRYLDLDYANIKPCSLSLALTVVRCTMYFARFIDVHRLLICIGDPRNQEESRQLVHITDANFKMQMYITTSST